MLVLIVPPCDLSQGQIECVARDLNLTINIRYQTHFHIALKECEAVFTYIYNVLRCSIILERGSPVCSRMILWTADRGKIQQQIAV